MTSLLWSVLIKPYLETILIEAAAAWVCKVRKGRDQGILLLVNTVTNPLVNLLVFFAGLRLPVQGVWAVIALLEAAVFLGEGRLFKSLLEKVRHPYLLSLACNGASFGLGMLLNRIF